MWNYVKEFKDLALSRGIGFQKDPSIGFEDMGVGKVVGRCYRPIGFREIALDQRNWENATVTTRKMLAFHELTHCYCAREHEAKFMHDGCPASIMAAEIVTDDCALLHQNYYENEMFNRCQPYK